jgi:hypothetical protein
MGPEGLVIEFEEDGFSCLVRPNPHTLARGIKGAWSSLVWLAIGGYWLNRIFFVHDHPLPQGEPMTTYFASGGVAVATIVAVDLMGRLVISIALSIRLSVTLVVDVNSEVISIGRRLMWVIPMPPKKVFFNDLRAIDIDPRRGDLVLVSSASTARIPMLGNAADNMGWLKEQLEMMMLRRHS